jgi:DNA-binding NarL/FixJ family response regulator
MVKVILTDDHKLFTSGLGKLLGASNKFEVLNSYPNGQILLQNLSGQNPDLLIIDYEMPGMNGIEIIKRVRLQNKKVKIVMLTSHNEWGYALDVEEAGANAYIVKSMDTEKLLEIMGSVMENINYFPKPTIVHRPISILSEREIQVLKLLSLGKQNEEISIALGISALTVKNHRRNIQQKLDAKNALDMVRLGFEKGLI